jgi:hypothetical protein
MVTLLGALVLVPLWIRVDLLALAFLVRDGLIRW